jgi:hypothetical protein
VRKPTTEQLFATEYEPPSNCHFGIVSAPLAAILGGGILGDIGASLLTGIAGSELLAGVTGGDPLKALESGAISGGIGGIAGAALGPAGAGLSSGVAQGIGGALGGGAGALATGGNPLTGAVTGGAMGALSGAFGGEGTTTPSSTTVAGMPSTGAGPSAASTAGVTAGGGAPVDLTAGVSGGGAPTDFFGIPAPSGGAGITPIASATGGGSINVQPLSSMAAPAGGGVSGASGASGGGNVDFSSSLLSSPDFGASGVTQTTAPGTSSVASTLGGTGSNILGFFEKNPGALIAGGLLGANMLLGDKPLPAEAAIQQNAGEAASHARTLEAYQQSGTLPPGLQSIVDQQTSAAEAELRSSFAKNGLSGSTMEAEQLGQLKRAKAGQIAALADNLAKQGIQWAGLSAQEFGQLLSAQQAQDAAFTQSLGLFAGGLAGLRGTGSSGSGAT